MTGLLATVLGACKFFGDDGAAAVDRFCDDPVITDDVAGARADAPTELSGSSAKGAAAQLVRMFTPIDGEANMATVYEAVLQLAEDSGWSIVDDFGGSTTARKVVEGTEAGLLIAQVQSSQIVQVTLKAEP